LAAPCRRRRSPNRNSTSQTHVDVLTRECDVWIDDDQVIEKGQYLLEKFDFAKE